MMIVGLSMVAGAGLMWAAFGIFLSHAAQKKIYAPSLLALLSVFGTALVWAVLPRYEVLSTGIPPNTSELAFFLIGSGMLNAGGILLIQKAMQSGHNGVVWTISQCALVFPFFIGVTFFSEQPTILRLLGVASILFCISMFGFIRSREDDGGASSGPAWFFLALGAFLCLGFQQTFASIPSHLDHLADHANLRVPFFSVGNSFIYLAFVALRRRFVISRIVWIALLFSLNGILSQVLLFGGLDRLSGSGMVSVGFPVAVGSCLIAFALYSLLIIKEKSTPWHLAGLGGGIVGIVLISL